jgi:hypothetical protein
MNFWTFSALTDMYSESHAPVDDCSLPDSKLIDAILQPPGKKALEAAKTLREPNQILKTYHSSSSLDVPICPQSSPGGTLITPSSSKRSITFNAASSI